jgi:hypothetical protein
VLIAHEVGKLDLVLLLGLRRRRHQQAQGGDNGSRQENQSTHVVPPRLVVTPFERRMLWRAERLALKSPSGNGRAHAPHCPNAGAEEWK